MWKLLWTCLSGEWDTGSQGDVLRYKCYEKYKTKGKELKKKIGQLYSMIFGPWGLLPELCVFIYYLFFLFFGLKASFRAAAGHLTSTTQGAAMYEAADVLRSTCINNLPDSPDGTLTNFVEIVWLTHLVIFFFFFHKVRGLWQGGSLMFKLCAWEQAGIVFSAFSLCNALNREHSNTNQFKNDGDSEGMENDRGSRGTLHKVSWDGGRRSTVSCI